MDRYLNHYSQTNNDGIRGHGGDTIVKKVAMSFIWKYENSSKIKNDYVILQTIVAIGFKKSTVTLSYGPTLRGQKVSYFQHFQNATPPTDYVA